MPAELSQTDVQAVAAAAALPPPVNLATRPSSEELERMEAEIKGVKISALRAKKAGDLAAAHQAMRKSKVLQATYDELAALPEKVYVAPEALYSLDKFKMPEPVDSEDEELHDGDLDDPELLAQMAELQEAGADESAADVATLLASDPPLAQDRGLQAVNDPKLRAGMAAETAVKSSIDGVPPPQPNPAVASQLFSASDLGDPLAPTLFEGEDAIAAEVTRLTALMQAAMGKMDMETMMRLGPQVKALQEKASTVTADGSASLAARLRAAAARDTALAVALRDAGRNEDADLVAARADMATLEHERLEPAPAADDQDLDRENSLQEALDLAALEAEAGDERIQRIQELEDAIKKGTWNHCLSDLHLSHSTLTHSPPFVDFGCLLTQALLIHSLISKTCGTFCQKNWRSARS